MRALGPLVALVVASGVADADVSLPATQAEPKWVARCSARLEAARTEAAVELPIFALAHVAGADLYLDESILGSATPAIFEAYVVPRRTQWSDPALTVQRWTAASSPAESTGLYRQSPTLEGWLVAYRMDRWLTRAQQRRAVAIFKIAVDDCLRVPAVE